MSTNTSLSVYPQILIPMKINDTTVYHFVIASIAEWTICLPPCFRPHEIGGLHLCKLKSLYQNDDHEV